MKPSCEPRRARKRRITQEFVVGQKRSLLSTVAEVMSTPAVAADPLSIVGRALQLAESRGVSHLPVAWEDGEIIGILCTCDLWYAQEHELVIQYMTLAVLTIRDTETLFRASEVMQQNDVGCLPVVDEEGRLSGMITKGDLLRAGVLGADELPPVCVGCGTRHHIRDERTVKSKPKGQPLCLRCRESRARRTG